MKIEPTPTKSSWLNRFLTRYGVDKTRLRNYDLVCDSTSASPDQIAERIVAHLTAPPTGTGPTICYLDPHRIYPTADRSGTGELSVGYRAPYFYAVDGHERLSSAIRDGRPLIATTLAVEAGEPVDGHTAEEYFATHVTPDRIRAWEDAHRITLPPVDDRQPAASTER